MEQNPSGKLTVSRLFVFCVNCNLMFCSQGLATCSCPEAHELVPPFPILLLSHTLILFSRLRLGIPSFRFCRFSCQIPVWFLPPIRAIRPAHLNLFNIISEIINVAPPLLLSAQVPSWALCQAEGEASPLRGAGSVQNTQHPTQDADHHVHMVRAYGPYGKILWSIL